MNVQPLLRSTLGSRQTLVADSHLLCIRPSCLHETAVVHCTAVCQVVVAHYVKGKGCFWWEATTGFHG